MEDLFYGALTVGVGFAVWEFQSFLRKYLNMKWQEIHALERISEQLSNIEMNIRPNPNTGRIG